jgi:holo-[acyl-carrier protein] synthase
MVLGIGTDLVAQSRIARLLARFGNRFIERILSKEEQILFEKNVHPAAFLARRFAAKEAVAKALGTGIGEHLSFNQISIINLSNGKPEVQFIGKAADFVRTLGAIEVMISLSDEKHYALAFAIVNRLVNLVTTPN